MKLDLVIYNKKVKKLLDLLSLLVKDLPNIGSVEYYQAYLFFRIKSYYASITVYRTSMPNNFISKILL